MTQPPDGDRQHPDPADQTPASPADQPTSSWQAPSDQPTSSWQAPSDQPTSSWQAPSDRPLDPPPADAGARPGGGGRRALMIVGVVLVAVLVLSGASLGTWLLLGDSDRDGAVAPATAVDSFLSAVYRDQDAVAASALVCSEARDEEALEAKIASIQAHQEAYHRPQFSWDDPEVVEETEQLAIVAVTVTMITGHEQTADHDLRVSVLDKDPHGWWVCDVDSVGDDDADDADDAGDGGEGENGGEAEDTENGGAPDAEEDGGEDE